MDIKDDPRFTKLPQRFIDELKGHPPTSPKGDHTWHEVQFDMNGIMCQCAVVDGEYVALPASEIETFTRIIKVWKAEELG